MQKTGSRWQKINLFGKEVNCNGCKAFEVWRIEQFLLKQALKQQDLKAVPARFSS